MRNALAGQANFKASKTADETADIFSGFRVQCERTFKAFCADIPAKVWPCKGNFRLKFGDLYRQQIFTKV